MSSPGGSSSTCSPRQVPAAESDTFTGGEESFTAGSSQCAPAAGFSPMRRSTSFATSARSGSGLGPGLSPGLGSDMSAIAGRTPARRSNSGATVAGTGLLMSGAGRVCDRRFVAVNGRPVDLPPVERAVLDALKQCVPGFVPASVFFLIQLTLPPGSFRDIVL